MNTSTQTAHTPGPWTIHEDTRRSSHMPLIGHCDSTGTPYIVASVCGSPRDANASLIAAAPALLAALREFLEANDYVRGPTQAEMQRKAAFHARAALAKATGVQP